MKNILSSTTLLLISSLLLILSCSSEKEIFFLDINGIEYKLSDYKGKWILINYWTSWCSHCRQEILELNAFFQEQKNSVAVFGVDYDKRKNKMLLKDENTVNPNFPILKNDPAKELGIKHINTIPTIIIIDPKGKVYKQLEGIQTQKTLKKIIQDG